MSKDAKCISFVNPKGGKQKSRTCILRHLNLTCFHRYYAGQNPSQEVEMNLKQNSGDVFIVLESNMIYE